MNIKENLGAKSYYRIQCFSAGFGYEPTWQNVNSSTDYDDALMMYNEIISLNTEAKFRLISETVSIDVLESNE